MVYIDMLLECERGIQHRLDSLHAIRFDRLLNLARMARRVLDDVLADLLLATTEQQIVARKVRMAEDMCSNEDVLRKAIARGEIRVPGVAGKHDLEQPRMAHVPLNELIDVAHSERPVRHAHRQSVDGDLHHEGVGDRLEIHPVERQPGAGRQLLDALDVALPVLGRIQAHEPSSARFSAVKKCLTAPQTSSKSLSAKLLAAQPAEASSANRRPVSVASWRDSPEDTST